MKIGENLHLISWSMADKMLYIMYGVVLIVQMQHLSPPEFGLYGLLINLHTWIFIVSDALALQNMIQFGINIENRSKVNLISLIMHIIVTIGAALLLYIFRFPFSSLFNEPKLVAVANALPILIALTIPRAYCLKFIYRNYHMRSLFFVNMSFFGVMTLITMYLIHEKNTLYFGDMLTLYFSGSAISSIVAMILTRRDFKFSFKGKIRLKEILSFGLPMMLTNTLISIPKNLDVFIIQYFFNTGVVGTYYSAKNLFRVFEETSAAAQALVYPASVKQLEKKNYKALHDVMTKAVSFVLISFIIIIFFLEAGLSRFLISTFLPHKYYLAISQFNIMALGALFLPFYILISIIIAYGKTLIALRNVIFSVVVSFIVFVIVGKLGNPDLAPLGYVSYLFSLGILCFLYSNRKFDFRLKYLYRAVGDSIHYVRNKFKF